MTSNEATRKLKEQDTPLVVRTWTKDQNSKVHRGWGREIKFDTKKTYGC